MSYIKGAFNTPKKRGGKRPGAGRKPQSCPTCTVRMTVKTETWAKIKRFGSAHGLPVVFLGPVVDRVMEGVEVPEPEYLRLARIAQSGV